MVDDPLDVLKEKTFLDEKIAKIIPKKTVMEQLREEFEDKVNKCLEEQKRLICKYDKNSAYINPWSCNVCNCQQGKFKDCENIRPVKYIASVYPDKLEQFQDEVRITLPPKIDVKGPHNTAGMEHISCGDKKNHTLKITQLYGFNLIKFPKGVPKTKHIEHENATFVNDELWAKEVDIYNSFVFQMKSDLLNKIEGLHVEALDGTALEKPFFTYNHEPRAIKPIWKDDWSEEYEGADFFQSSFLPKMPPPEWGDKEALREWVSNALDVTPEGEKVDLGTDEHGNITLEYDSSDERILTIKHLGCLGSHEEAISSKKGIIGRFGEGIKQANVIFMRKNRWMKIEAVGYTYYPVWGWDKMAESYLVHTYRVPNKRKHGTKIIILNVNNPENLISDTKRLYLRWRSDYNVLFTDEEGNEILSEFTSDAPNSRRVSVNGSLTQPMEGEQGPPMLFNYNLIADEEEKEKLVDRDRKFADIDEIRFKARGIIRQLGEEQKDIMQKICETYNKTRGAEMDLHFNWGYLGDDKIPLWKEAVDNTLKTTMFMSGSAKIAIAWDVFKDQNLRTLGWTIVDWGGSGNSLLEKCGYKYSKDFSESIGVPRVLPLAELEPRENEVYEAAKDNLRFLLKHYWREEDEYIDRLLDNYDQYDGMAVASSFQGCQEAEDLEGIKGMYRTPPINKIYVHRDALRNGVIDSTGVLIHEFIHKYYDVRDESRDFENRFTSLSGHTGHKWATIQEAIRKEYQRTKDPMINIDAIPIPMNELEPTLQPKEEEIKIPVETEEKPITVEEIRCWRCENVSTVKENPVIMPVFKTFPQVLEMVKCGEGVAVEFPYLLKPECSEGY